MEKNDLLEIVSQLRELNKQKVIENYLKLYEITHDPKVLSYVCSLMKYVPEKSEHDEKIDAMFGK